MATESSILSSLGITDPQVQASIMNGTTPLLILDASAHLDWDWLLPFPVLVTGGQNLRSSVYFQRPGADPSNPNGPGVGWTNQIFAQAIGLLANTNYHYSICETGFLRALAQTNPALFNTLTAYWSNNKNLRFTGGGITSPDNQLTHGEAFIRNYLVGNIWLAANFNGFQTAKTCWIPDDFGHDPELPVILQAMGMIAAGFERVPGTQSSWKHPVSKTPSMNDMLSAGNNKIDFTWTASDGSSIIAHWLIGGYGQGNSIATTDDITTYLGLNQPHSPTAYMYVPVLNDFALPNTKLSAVLNNWAHLPGNIIAVAGSFEDYAQLLQFHNTALDAPYGQEFNANPYYTGCYGSRPELKILQQRATRNLLAAETFSIIAGWAQPFGSMGTLGNGINWRQALEQAWNLLVPSTHHDYITGTAIPDVYHTEQITLLQQADSLAESLLQQAMQTIAGAVNPGFSSGVPVVVFNPLGFQRSGIAEIDAADMMNNGIDLSGPGYQSTADGGLLFQATVPSLGFQTITLNTGGTAPANLASVTPASPVNGQPVKLQNGLLTATLLQDARGVWGLVSVNDSATNTELIKAGPVAANSLQFYADGGDEYLFGMEVEDNPMWTLTTVDSFIKNNTIDVIEYGPLRVVVRTSMLYNDGTFNINYTTDYILYANEPMLRMRVSGAAPMLLAGHDKFHTPIYGASVVLAFPLTSAVDTIERGTAYHWTDASSVYWNDQTFLPTHNFVIPMSGQQRLCAFYHSDMPAWGLNNQWNGQSFGNDGILYACAWRNGDGHYYNWVTDPGTPLQTMGTDPAMHVHEFALRIPSSLQGPVSGQPLQESLSMASPLKAIPVAQWTGVLNGPVSLASLSNPAATITAVKPGSVNEYDIIFRIYQPTNQSLQTTLNLSPYLVAGATGPTGPSGPIGATSARGQTALEQDLSPDQENKLNMSVSGNGVTFTMETALATIAITV